MPAGRFNRKTDENQREIIAGLIAFGATVHDASAEGGGFPDLVVGYKGINFLFEVKKPLKKSKEDADHYARLNDIQKSWHDNWDGIVHVVTTSEEAISILRDAVH